MASPFNQRKAATRTASAPRPAVKHNYESVEITQSSEIVTPWAPVVTELQSPASPKLRPVTRTASVPRPTVQHNYEPVEFTQTVPSPVAARPKSPNTVQANTPIYGNVTTKENTIRCSRPPVAPKQVSYTPPTEQRNTLPAPTKSEQQVSPVRNTLPVTKNQQPSPVTVRKNNNTSNVAALTKEIETKLQCPQAPSPVATRPKLQMSPITARRNSPSYNNTPSTVTDPLQRAPSPAVAKRAQQESPAIKQRNGPVEDDGHLYTEPSITEGYVNTADVLSSKQERLTSPNSKHSESPVHSHDPQDYEYIAMNEGISHNNNPQITAADHERNKAYLRSLSCRDVLRLLDKMNLSQHKASFQKEQVDGVTLAELTKHNLEIELGVTQGIHLIRLEHLIKGIKSAKDILENNN